uniref:Nuclear receptor domain-containing protein n=1 Tax=Caenorhabditis tropicalis TaxID=1561998 RepID=A0A1I7U7E9_9PELO
MISGPFLQFDPTFTFQALAMGHQHDGTSPMSIPCSSTSPNVVPDASSDIHCRVCRRRYDGSQHFGIDVSFRKDEGGKTICRACAAFFRRSVAVKKTFVCRRGTNNCALNIVSGHRSPDHVKASSRDETIKREGDESDSGSEKKEEKTEIELPPSPFQFPTNFTSVLRPIPTFGAADLVTTGATFLNKLITNYNEFTRNRLEVELSLPHMQQDSKIFGSTGIPIVKATREIVNQIHKKQVELLHVFLQNTFDEYALCDEQEQKRICARFYPVLWELESCYWTYRNMPVNSESEYLLMCTQTTYIDVRETRMWLGEDQDEIELQEYTMKLQNIVLNARTSILERMHRMILKEFEFISLLAIHIWAPDHLHHTASQKFAEQVRATLFNDLHYSYHDGLKIDNYASRIGEFMCLYTLTDITHPDISSAIHAIFFSHLRPDTESEE